MRTILKWVGRILYTLFFLCVIIFLFAGGWIYLWFTGDHICWLLVLNCYFDIPLVLAFIFYGTLALIFGLFYVYGYNLMEY